MTIYYFRNEEGGIDFCIDYQNWSLGETTVSRCVFQHVDLENSNYQSVDDLIKNLDATVLGVIEDLDWIDRQTDIKICKCLESKKDWLTKTDEELFIEMILFCRDIFGKQIVLL